MGQKISPTSFRIAVNRPWASRWFGGRKYTSFLRADVAVRKLLDERLRGMSVDQVVLERGDDALKVIIYTARPGLIIGRGGSGIDELKKRIIAILKKKVNVQVEIQELKNPEASAAVVAESIAEQIEKRIPFRRIMKMTLAKIMASRDVKGAKIQIGGRLDGAEIARLEHLEAGSLPLQTLRADIDFARQTAYTTYGTVGIKIWIYKGQVFDTKQ